MSEPSGAVPGKKIVVTRPFEASTLETLTKTSGLDVVVLPEGAAADRSKLLAAVGDAQGLFSMISESIDEELFAAARRLEIVSNMAVGYDNIDIAAASQRGVVVCNTPDVLTETTAELTIALMFAASRRIAEADRFVRAGQWSAWGPQMLLGLDLAGSTLGIVGAGRIGRAVARRANALGIGVVYASRSASRVMEEELSAQRLELDQLMAEADVVSLHVPLTPDTRRLIDRRRLGLMKNSAILLNTSRGQVVDERALAAALASGDLFAAGLDVFEDEPSVCGELLELENVVLLPHIGSATVATRRRMAAAAVENLVRFFSGREPLSVVKSG